MRKFFKRLFCRHKYVTTGMSNYMNRGSERALLTATFFRCKCSKCGKIKIFSSKWW